MILLIILALILLGLITIVIGAVSVGGTVFIAIFADVIVCAAVIVWIIVRLVKKKRDS